MAFNVGPLVLYNEPGSGTFAISGSGSSPAPAILTDATHLYNGRPADQTAFQWGGGTQSTASNIAITRAWTTAIVPGVITVRAVSGQLNGVAQSVPAGVLATVVGSLDGVTFATALGGNTVNLASHQFPDGSIGWVFVCDAGLAAIKGYKITILNSASAAVWITTGNAPNYILLIGETMCYQAWQPPQSVKFNWTFSYDGVPTVRQSTNNQPWPLATLPFDKLDVELCAADYATTFGAIGSPTAVTYRNISRNLVNGNPSGFIVRTVDTSNAIDNWAIHELAIFGTATTVGQPKPLGGDYYELDLTYSAAAPGT